MTVTPMPPTQKSLGNKLVVFLTTPPAATTGIPTVTEVNAALFAGCHIFGDFNVTPSQNTGEGPRKMCSRNSPTELGLVTFPAVDVQYSYMPQELGTPGADGNEVYEALDPDAVITAVVLAGIEGTVGAVATGDIADIYEMTVGARRKGATGDGEFDQLSTTQSLIVNGGVAIAEDHAMAAA
ncbi:MAG TPA: hypothetical protein VIP58_10265 [Nocardioides sp.]